MITLALADCYKFQAVYSARQEQEGMPEYSIHLSQLGVYLHLKASAAALVL
jgi:hypothetical protein